MLKISLADCRGLSPAILSEFSVEMCAASKNCEKFTKNHFWGVQCRSSSLMFTNLKSLSSVLVMISSKSVPICNRFHTIRTNNCKITSFGGTPLWRFRSWGNISSRGTKFCREKIETLRQPMVKISWS